MEKLHPSRFYLFILKNQNLNLCFQKSGIYYILPYLILHPHYHLIQFFPYPSIFLIHKNEANFRPPPIATKAYCRTLSVVCHCRLISAFI